MAQIPIPSKATWEANMATYGEIIGQGYTNGSNPTDDNKLAWQYYDGAWVFQQIYNYRHDKLGITESKWFDYALQANMAYQRWAQLYGWGGIQGNRIFPQGLYYSWLRTGNTQYKTDLISLSQLAAYCPDTTPIAWTSGANGSTPGDGGSREAAYVLEAYLYAEKVGEPVRAKRNLLVDQILDHFSQWVITKTADYVRMFMMALSAQSLITLYEHEPSHARVVDNSIINMLSAAFEWGWSNLWIPSLRTFPYTDRVVPSGGTEPTPDLNLLIAPVYAWLYHRTGLTKWRDYGDQIFSGGADAGVNLFDGKQFNQQYRWSFRYVEWRELDPLVDPPPIDPPPDPDPDPDPTPTHPPGEISQLYSVRVPTIILPVSGVSFADKFSQNGWANIDEQIADGYQLWIQPGALTAQLVEIIDLKAPVQGATLITLTYNPILLDGSVTVTPSLSLSTDAITWVDYAGVSQVLASNFRYVKIKLDALATNKRGVVQIDEVRLRLALKEKRDGGSGAAVATDYTGPSDPHLKGTLVNFNKTFIDIDQLIVTAQYQAGLAPDLAIAYYNFQDVINPTGFRVFIVKKSDGTVINGNFDWSAKGV